MKLKVTASFVMEVDPASFHGADPITTTAEQIDYGDLSLDEAADYGDDFQVKVEEVK